MMFDRDAPPPLALTMGDPAGVGPELTLRAWLARDTAPAPFFALADPRALSALARRLALDVPILEVAPGEARGAFVRALPVVPLGARADAKAGAPDPAYAAAVLESIERAVGYVKSGEARALVTNPIAKATLYAAGFKFPGHTEFLGALAERHWGGPSQPVMMIWSPELAVVPVTIHIALERSSAPPDAGADRLDRADRRRRHDAPLRRRKAAPRARRPQPARGRRRRDGARRDRDHRAGDRGLARWRARGCWPAARRHDVPRRRARRATTSR